MSSMKKTALIVCTSILFLHLSVQPTLALNTPPLFSCQSPVGSTIAAFDSGSHGIAGDSANYTGSDHVYSIDSDHVLQCFCPTGTSEGIASNWTKLTDPTETNIEYYQKLGWTYVPNGQAWGLDDAAYIVKNDHFACYPEAGGDGGGNSNSGG